MILKTDVKVSVLRAEVIYLVATARECGILEDRSDYASMVFHLEFEEFFGKLKQQLDEAHKWGCETVSVTVDTLTRVSTALDSLETYLYESGGTK